MKIKYLFRSLFNIDVENVYLYRTNTCIMGLYRNKRLAGCMQQNGSPFSVAKMVGQVEEIFPKHHLNIGSWKRENSHIGIYADQNPHDTHYFDHNYNQVSSQGKYTLNKNFWNIEPIPALLKKSDTLVAGLYLHHLLLGFLIFDDCKSAFTDFAPHITKIFPENLNDLDAFIEKNENRIVYYNSNDIVLFDENNNVIRDNK
ncbi:hypothetical protein ACI75Y_07120 [Capnocytophaga stomatis]|uniref:hypothetical protein n=1 Tax=Capnocytophaga stomatis TaxID=1848904 RepID=UPI00385FD2E0